MQNNNITKDEIDNMLKLNKMTYTPFEDPIEGEIRWFQKHIRGIDYKTTVNTDHVHSFFEIQIPMSEMSYNVNGCEIKISSGEWILIAPQTPHRRSNSTEEMKHFSIALSLKNSSKNKNIIDILSTNPCFTGKVNHIISECISYALEEAGRNYKISSTVIKNLLFSIFVEILRQISPIDPFEFITPSKDSRVLMAEAFINKNFQSIIRLEDVAIHCHISPKQINRLFKKENDCSVTEYIHAKKINEAKKLISQKEYSIKDISQYLGFLNDYNFVRYFKTHVGITPGSYKRRCK